MLAVARDVLEAFAARTIMSMFDTELGVCLLGNGLVISAEYRIEYIYCIIVDQSVQSTVNIGPDISKLNSIRNIQLVVLNVNTAIFAST